jgi:hypothetical protein
MMTGVVADLGALMMAIPAHMSTGRRLSTTSTSFVKSLLKKRIKGREKVSKGA